VDLPQPTGSGPRRPGFSRPELQPGRLFADHKLIRPIGHGSYGEVWLCANILTSTPRAIKFVWRDAFDSDRPYEREFEAVKNFEPLSGLHPGVIQVLHVGPIENGFFYIMELGDNLLGGDPATHYQVRTLSCKSAGELLTREAVEIGIFLADCLAFLHGRKLLHRDIKPSNVIFVGGRPKLADIGLVAHFEEATSFVGTLGFVPPEGPTNPQADIYALGKLLYEITTGRDRHDFPALPDDITKDQQLLLELNPVLLRACDSQRSKRFATAEQFKAELEMVQAGKSVRKVRRLEARVRHLSLVLVLLIVAAALGGFAYVRKKAAEAKLIAELHRKIGVLLATGNEKLKRGDLIGSWPMFLSAAEIDRDKPTNHQLRLGAISSQMFKPLKIWTNQFKNIKPTPNGERMALATAKSVEVYDLRRGACLHHFDLSSSTLAISDDGQALVSAVTNKVSTIDLNSGAISDRFLSHPVQTLCFQPNTHIPWAIIDHPNEQLVLPLDGSGSPFVAANTNNFFLFFSPSGKFLATVGYASKAELWNTRTGHKLPWAPAHGSMIYRAIFTPDERFVATCSFDGTALVWDLATGIPTGAPFWHEDGIYWISYSPKLQLFATTAFDGQVKFWRESTHQPLASNPALYLGHRGMCGFFVGESSFFTASLDGRQILWDILPSPPQLREMPFSSPLLEKAAIHRDETALRASGTNVTGRLNGHPFQVSFNSPVEVITLSPASDLLAIGTADRGLAEHAARIFDGGGRDTGITLPHKDGILHLAFNHRGDRIATASEDFTARIWDPRTGQPITPTLRHKHQVTWVAFNSTDDWLATASRDQTVIIWDAATGDPLTPPLNFGQKLQFIQFEPGDKSILASSTNQLFKLDLPFATNSFSDLRKILPFTSFQDQLAQ
jgi:WD40 repeat protein